MAKYCCLCGLTGEALEKCITRYTELYKTDPTSPGIPCTVEEEEECFCSAGPLMDGLSTREPICPRHKR